MSSRQSIRGTLASNKEFGLYDLASVVLGLSALSAPENISDCSIIESYNEAYDLILRTLPTEVDATTEVDVRERRKSVRTSPNTMIYPATPCLSPKSTRDLCCLSG